MVIRRDADLCSRPQPAVHVRLFYVVAQLIISLPEAAQAPMTAVAASVLAEVRLAPRLTPQARCSGQVALLNSGTGRHRARILQLNPLRGAVHRPQPFLACDSHLFGDEDLQSGCFQNGPENRYARADHGQVHFNGRQKNAYATIPRRVEGRPSRCVVLHYSRQTPDGCEVGTVVRPKRVTRQLQLYRGE